MIKKIILPLLIMVIIAAFVNAAVDSDTERINITINIPAVNSYSSNEGAIKLNATVAWSFDGKNITNLTFYFIQGTNVTTFTNSTINGTGGLGVFVGDFTYTLQANALSEGTYTVLAEAVNTTLGNGNFYTNSSSLTFVVDKTAPSAKISVPVSGSTVVPSYNQVTFEYTPIDSNLGNCSLHLDEQLAKQSSSDTTSPNVTSNIINRFTHGFSANNASIRVAVVCLDLAGNDGGGNNFTFGVLLGATPYAIKQLQAGGGGGGGILQQQNKGFSVSGTASKIGISSTHLEKYLFVYILLAVIVLIVIFRKKFK